MNFKSSLPDFYEEVRLLLIQGNRSDLANQLAELTIVQPCRCTDPGCASFQVKGSNTPDGFEQPAEKRSIFNSSINLNADKGKVLIRTDQLGRIKAFEVLNRPDVRRSLFKSIYR